MMIHNYTPCGMRIKKSLRTLAMQDLHEIIYVSIISVEDFNFTGKFKMRTY